MSSVKKSIPARSRTARGYRRGTTALPWSRGGPMRTPLEETEQGQIQQELEQFLLDIPNLPLDAPHRGDSEESATEIRKVGTPQAFSFSPKDHVDLGEALGIFDFTRATKLSGPRFTITRGIGAELERALASLFLA